MVRPLVLPQPATLSKQPQASRRITQITGNEDQVSGPGTIPTDNCFGLSVDLLHLCEESGTGAEIDLAKLPLSPSIRALEKKPEGLALHGGEDYQLLFAVSPGKAGFIARLAKRFRIRQIGKMTRRKEIFVIDSKGRRCPLKAGGYEHSL